MTEQSLTSALEQALDSYQSGDLARCLEHLQLCLDIDPQCVDALNMLGILQIRQGDNEAAISTLKSALEIQPGFEELHVNIGSAYRAAGYIEMAIEHADAALEIDPENLNAKVGKGLAFKILRRLPEAEEQLSQVLAKKLDYAGVYPEIAEVYHLMGQFDDAISAFQQAIRYYPNMPQLRLNLAQSLQANDNLEAATEVLADALEQFPGEPHLLERQCLISATGCNWDLVEEHAGTLAKNLEKLDEQPGYFVPTPFIYDATHASPNLQSIANRHYSRFIQDRYNAALAPAPSSIHLRPRIGYYGGDFCSSAVGILLADVVEAHDYDHFEIHLYDHHPEPDEFAERFRNSGAEHHACTNLSPLQVAEMIQADGIDVLVDISGYTKRGWPDVLPFRPAPHNVSLLGYLNSTQSEFMDHLIADAMVIPTEDEAYYSESISRLEGSLIPFPAAGRATEPVPRSDLGLPEDVFVFCSFNNTYKLTREVAELWASILNEVPGSVLWLGTSGPLQGLDRFASMLFANGVEESQLVPAPGIQYRHHVQRLASAGLMLDTFPYNAGATASSAACAGLPLLTLQGDTFKSRLGASVNRAVGTPELIASSVDEYRELAVRFATEPEFASGIRDQLKASLETDPGLSPKAYASNLESIYKQILANGAK
jgi:predicted O-linked N-acetylglucosamine transferase (SPINDLY family)